MTSRGKLKRFGYPTIQGMPKPKGWSELHQAYLKHKLYLFDVKRVDLVYHKLGIGQTGARYFRYFRFPPLSYWNPDIQFVFTKIRGPIPKSCPSLTIEYTNGIKKQLKLDSTWKDRHILDQFLNLVSYKDPGRVRETLGAETMYEHQRFISPRRAKQTEIKRQRYLKDEGTISTIYPDSTQNTTPPSSQSTQQQSAQV